MGRGLLSYWGRPTVAGQELLSVIVMWKVSSPNCLILSFLRFKLKSEGPRASLRSSRTTCARRLTCWGRVAATCSPTLSVPTRSVSDILWFSNQKCALLLFLAVRLKTSVSTQYSRRLYCTSGRRRLTPCPESRQRSRDTCNISSPHWK